MMVASPCAMHFDVWQTTSRNHFAHCRWAPSTQRSNGGKANLPHEHPPSGHHGPSHRTCHANSSNFSGRGITKWSNTKYLAIFHRSKRCSSNTQLYSINCATTNKPSMIGPPPIHPSVVAKIGRNTNLPLWTLKTTIGFYLVPFSIPCCRPLLRWLLKVPLPIRSSHPRRITWTNYITVYVNGPNEMAYHRCQPRKSQILDISCGRNTTNTSLNTSPNPPSPSFNPPLKAQSSIAKTNKLHLFESTAPAFTTKPFPTHFMTLQFLKQWTRIRPPQLTHSSQLSLVNTDSNTHGQLEQDVNYQQATFWPNERKLSAVDDQSSPLWTHRSVPCLTFWPGWSSSSSPLLAPIISPQGMSTICFPSWDQLPLMVTWFLLIRTLQASSPVSIKTDSFDLGSCSWTSCDPRWMSPIKKFSRSIRENPTIQETSSKVEPSVVWMSQEKSWSKTFRTSSNQLLTCKLSLLDKSASCKVEAVQWAALCLRHCVWWLSPSANKSGPSTSTNFSPTIPSSSVTSGMSTIAWFLVTNVFLTLHPTKFSSTMAFMANLSFLKLNQIKSFLDSCSRQNPWNWYTRDLPTCPKSCHHFQHRHQKFCSAGFARVATSSSKEHSLNLVYFKVLPS